MKHYINLTNGIEFIPSLQGVEYRFIRIQSTACEQKRWDNIIQDLDVDFMFNLAIGETCIVYDMGDNKPISRAVYQGLSWINYALSKNWLGLELSSIVRGNDATAYFKQVYRTIEPKTRARMEYFRKFVNTDLLHIEYKSASTVNDNNLKFYQDIVKSLVL